MNEKINRLAKGMIESETLTAELSPAAFSEPVGFSESGRREFVIRSAGNTPLRGLCYSDNPRVQIENAVFVGGKNRIIFHVDTSFLKTGTVIFGKICLITNAGEFSLPYRFTAAGESVYDEALLLDAEAEADILEAGEPDAADPDGTGKALSEFEAFLLSDLPEDETLFTELTALLIRERQTSLFAFRVYEEAVKRDIKLTQLYEYYLYAFPEGNDEPMPREILLYFSYDSTLSPNIKSVVYKNVLQYTEPDSELYRRYEPEMRDYAFQSVFCGRIDDRLAVIYKHMIYPDMIDARVAEHLPALLKSQRIFCQDARMRRVAVRYPEIRGEEIFPLYEGIAYVPVYFDDAELLFIDGFGKYYRGVRYEAEAAMDGNELLERCFALCPGHPAVMLGTLRKLLGGSIHSEQERDALLNIMRRLPLRHDARAKAAEVLIAFGGPMDFLPDIDVDGLSGLQKSRIFSALVAGGERQKAYAVLRRYGLLIADEEALRALCLAMISADEVPKDAVEQRFFLAALRRLFDNGARDRELLSCLARYYEGATEDLYAILSAADAAGAETSQLPERTLITKLFSGVRSHLDETFAIYSRTDPRELLVRAYLSVRASDYFVDGETVPETVFDALRDILDAAADRAKLPSIYLMAWTKYISCRSGEQPVSVRALLTELTEILCREGLIFSYFPELEKWIELPEKAAGKTVIEYHGSRFQKPRLLMKIEPEDQDFREEEMTRIYQGIYIKETELFSDDELHYVIYDRNAEGAEEPAAEGTISGKRQPSHAIGTRKERLDEMTSLLLSGKEEELLVRMKDYVLQDETGRALFGIEEQGV
ncbi:MAG: DUF5717 family protein [Eubacteriales bacterium]|nr:DUF5717 family protein [Eubacteriales bacterium]